jgi:hypothetical protein
LREYTFQTSKHAGSEILKLNDERGFIIEPLLELSPLKPAVQLEEVLNSFRGVTIPKI